MGSLGVTKFVSSAFSYFPAPLYPLYKDHVLVTVSLMRIIQNFCLHMCLVISFIFYFIYDISELLARKEELCRALCSTVTPLLTHSNYHIWARSMRRALGSKNKYKFVDGSIEVPNIADPSYIAWERCNLLVHSWVMNSVSDSIAQSIVFLENAIVVWRDLKDRFSQGT